MDQKLTFYHFFEDRMNLYGDRGNITILANRAKWRGIEVEVKHINDVHDIDLSDADFFMIGGGSDREQGLVTHELEAIKDKLAAIIEDGVAGLAICGGYQMLGNYYELASGEKLPGLGILDFYSKSETTDLSKRLIGNILVKSPEFGNLVGFENHGGETYHGYPVLGDVVRGFGNTRDGQKEGLVYKNLICTYIHGPLLSKNPKLADALLSKMLERKYGDGTLAPLKDLFEDLGNKQEWQRLSSS
ncbi:MAG: glutamine amidotransferase [Turicibacter sp.]|nr:glutamine amidotransferase [Turicibacter sp.]